MTGLLELVRSAFTPGAEPANTARTVEAVEAEIVELSGLAARLSTEVSAHRSTFAALKEARPAWLVKADRGDDQARQALADNAAQLAQLDFRISDVESELHELHRQLAALDQERTAAETRVTLQREAERAARQRAVGRRLDELGTALSAALTEYINLDVDRACDAQLLGITPRLSLGGRVVEPLAGIFFRSLPANVKSFSTRVTLDIEAARRGATFEAVTLPAINAEGAHHE